MFQFLSRRPLSAALALACLAAAPTFAAAQAAAHTQNRPDPLNPGEVVPAMAFRSSLADFRRFEDQRVGSWQRANETVNRIGGWRSYAREANRPDTQTQPQPAVPAPTSAAPKPGAADRAGHQGHQGRATP